MASTSDPAKIDEEESASYVRADEFDPRGIDIELEEKLAAKALAKRGGEEEEDEGPKAAWEIDLSRLHIRRLVAKGAHGTLFRAEYGGEDVAVKLLDLGEDGARLRASLEELAAVWHVLDHPNVAKFVGASMGTTTDLNIPGKGCSSSAGGADSACCVVVEFLSGGTLKNHLIDHFHRKLPYREVVRLALSMAMGLSYLHGNRIVHRDVKTDNFLLDAHRLSLKIAGFGVARIVEAHDGSRELTGMTGTPGYMAPEVLDGKPYDYKCDVYSFGICLWETYCCDMPFSYDLSLAELWSAIVHDGLRPKVPVCCPADMAIIMERCWDADPAKRPEMDEVVRLLMELETSKGGGMVPESKTPGCFSCFLGPIRGP
ncbi:hypothetical protein E2562_028667 [Oryza meyeriana var. granulata]|uniref:Protein kinase domain-containing protein n=1 Tax=Oryza meyeriana var. granulata TaxID=110450 RepID=A0A6G1BQA6_9ORYZ|nr:hypothetical protein E2562_028667 [Oryza meyeriana var. granulata]